MPEITLYNKDGQEIGPLSLSDEVFGVEPNIALVHQAVITEEANARQGNASTKTRGLVSGGGKKPWRQKGTGRARQGSTRSPQWRHGGIVWGPHPRSYNKAFPIKMRRGALRVALSSKVADGQMIGLDAFQIETIKTKSVTEMLSRLPLVFEAKVKHFEGRGVRVEGMKKKNYNVLLIVPEHDEILIKSCRNIPYLTLRYAPNFSVRDVVNAGRVVLAQGAVSKIEEVLTK